ncbi:hypothetical protein IMY05_005G0084000 [Salix suchowensis]|nr:hypothetical protein IMY05_005G0084000 [Salix suchowensis]
MFFLTFNYFVVLILTALAFLLRQYYLFHADRVSRRGKGNGKQEAPPPAPEAEKARRAFPPFHLPLGLNHF